MFDLLKSNKEECKNMIKHVYKDSISITLTQNICIHIHMYTFMYAAKYTRTHAHT